MKPKTEPDNEWVSTERSDSAEKALAIIYVTHMCVKWYTLVRDRAAHCFAPSHWASISPLRGRGNIFVLVTGLFLSFALTLILVPKGVSEGIIPNCCSSKAVFAAAPTSSKAIGPSITVSRKRYAPPPYTKVVPSLLPYASLSESSPSRVILDPPAALVIFPSLIISGSGLTRGTAIPRGYTTGTLQSGRPWANSGRWKSPLASNVINTPRINEAAAANPALMVPPFPSFINVVNLVLLNAFPGLAGRVAGDGMAEFNRMLKVKNIVVGNLPANYNYDLSVFKLPSSRSIDNNCGVWGSPFVGFCFMWPLRIDQARFDSGSHCSRSIVGSENFFLVKFVNFNKALDVLGRTFANIGQADRHSEGFSVLHREPVGLVGIQQQPSSLIHRNLALKLGDRFLGFAQLKKGQKGEGDCGCDPQYFKSPLRFVPYWVALFGFCLYAYGYWGAKFGSDKRWDLLVYFVAGIFVFSYGIVLILKNLGNCSDVISQSLPLLENCRNGFSEVSHNVRQVSNFAIDWLQ